MTWIQEWSDVLFMHFPVSADAVQRRLPRGIEVDEFEACAWIGYIFFRLTVRPSWLPTMPGFSSLLELNVRTYVRCAGQPGIYFFRMYADNRLAIAASRLFTPLCYEPAQMIDERRRDGSRHIECRPVSTGAGILRIHCSMASEVREASPGSIDEWLLERYRLFVARRSGAILAAEVEHPPWTAARVEATQWEDSLCEALGFASDCAPCLHFSPGVAAWFKAFAPVRPIAQSSFQIQPLAAAD